VGGPDEGPVLTVDSDDSVGGFTDVVGAACDVDVGGGLTVVVTG